MGWSQEEEATRGVALAGTGCSARGSLSWGTSLSSRPGAAGGGTWLLPRASGSLHPGPHCPTLAALIPSQLCSAGSSPDCGVKVLTPKLQTYWGLRALQACRAKVLLTGEGASCWAVTAPRGCTCAGDTLPPLPSQLQSAWRRCSLTLPAPSPRNFCLSHTLAPFRPMSCPLIVLPDFTFTRDRDRPRVFSPTERGAEQCSVNTCY